ncbi:MAG: hypothetical protein LBD96_02350 [Treponema sp.]|jgi:hypothetical protein|nr:hypothetical protein [Treponema sp.]
MITVSGKLDGQQPEDHDGQRTVFAVDVPAVRKKPDVTDLLPGQTRNGAPFDPENLRKKINNEEYLYEAIQRIAQVLSSELLKMSQGRIYHERQRKRRK